MPTLFVLENRSAKRKGDLKKKEKKKTGNQAHAHGASHDTRGSSLALYPIQQAKVCES